MSKVLMKLRLQKNINRQIQRENYELRMQLQALEEEKQRLQDRLLCHEYFHMSIFHELERKLQMAPSISKVGQAENEIVSLALSPSKNMIEKEDSSYSHQDGECSRVAEAKRTSDEEVLHKKLALPSSPEKSNMCKSSPGKDVHATGEGMKTFPTGEWSSYPCASCGTRNHDVEKYPRRQSVQVNPSKKKADHFSSQRKRRNDKKGSWNKTLCSYCGKSGHQIEKCWTLYPHLCLKKNLKDVKTLARRQATTPDEVNGLTERLGKEYFLMVGLGKVIYEDIEEWFMDSGSSRHMTGMRSIFLTFSESDTDCFVGSGTNTRQAIKGYGYVRFQLESGGFMGIEHMLYVPDLKVNLLSVASFEDDGYVVTFQNGRVLVYSREATPDT
jgi:hypothetical protein